MAGLALVAPAAAQDWGSDYNQGIIGVLGGTEAGGTISLNCADNGNGVVVKGDLSIFLNPGVDSEIGDASPGELTFSVDGKDVVLPVSADQGDGFVYEKTAATLDHATQLLDLLETGKTLVVTGEGKQLASIGLEGAGAALDGVEVCLVP
ncbi:hypothetical protein SAMN05428969_2354 [Devosia sp. YR412]|uniref:hypothetical protein n=1 Tax=Devosia sp. YR412 TaxID=1881030 RepID=UPI0008B28AD3|nr:hypothetical protein [Devosia sp. YR412]SEQ23982.1 hypothetical protein SAMN05428969_2354 [Devosia sp. YR412]